MLFFETVVFGFALWLGAYLVSRNPRDSRLLLVGLGMIAYAVALALDILMRYAANIAQAENLLRWQRPLLFLPAAFWLLLLFLLSRGDETWHARLQGHRQPLLLILIGSIFFGLALALILLPLELLPRSWIVLAMGFDLALLGLGIGLLDAIDQGERLLPHLARSFEYALIFAFVFGGQVGLVMWWSTGVTLAMLTLLLNTVAAAILIQTFARPFQNSLDRLALGREPLARQERVALRDTADALPRQNLALDLAALDEETFTRLTRRALSHMGSLPRLAANPLTHLPQIERRIASESAGGDTLGRSAELKTILAESIERLKPDTDETFGVTDAWRFYNALYFPYVAGLKPYSRRATFDDLAPSEKQAMEWFRSQVPQRTLYNWQNAAARLIAQDLRERSWPGQAPVFAESTTLTQNAAIKTVQ